MADNPVLAAAEVLSTARDSVIDLLKDQNASISLKYKAQLTAMVNQLRFLSGQGPENANNAVAYKKTPITNFMGDKLTTPKPIKTEDLTPKQLEKKIFEEKVQKLQENFDNLTNEQILEAYKVDPIVIRGVARNAGLEEFKKAEINLQFLEDIRLGLKSQKEGQLALQQSREEVENADTNQ